MGPSTAKLKHKNLDIEFQAAFAYLKKFVSGDDWQLENDYSKFIKSKQEWLNKNKKNVIFSKK